MLDTFQVDMSPQFPSNTVQSLVIGMATRVKRVALMLFHQKMCISLKNVTSIQDQGVTEFGIHYRLESCLQ